MINAKTDDDPIICTFVRAVKIETDNKNLSSASTSAYYPATFQKLERGPL